MTTSNQTIVDKISFHKNDLKKAALAIRSINHPLRLKMIHVINELGEVTVTVLYERLGIEQSVCSQMLRVMRASKIVSTRRDGKFIFYSICYDTINLICNKSVEMVK